MSRSSLLPWRDGALLDPTAGCYWRLGAQPVALIVSHTGMGWGAAIRIELDEAERLELQARMRRREIERTDAMRTEIVLLAASGMSNLAIARPTVATWRKRFATSRLDGLLDEPRPCAPRKIGDAKIAEVVTTTPETMPAAPNALENAVDGQGVGCVDLDGAPHLVGVLAAAASQRNLQALDRSPVRRKGSRHRWSLPQPTRSRADVVR